MSDPNAIVIAFDEATHVNDWQPGETYGTSDFVLSIAGGTQITIKSFDLHAMKARISVRFVATRPFVAGPARALGVGPTDGGGWLFLNGRVIRIPPRGPERAFAETLGNVLAAQSGVEGLGPQLRQLGLQIGE